MIMTLGEKLLQAARHNGRFLTQADVRDIARDPLTRLTVLLVRCERGRFMAPAQDVVHFIDIIEENGRDHVRDVSVPVRSSIP